MEPNPTDWPEVTRTARPWTRWWWLGSAVDKANLTRLLEAYRQAGLGGVEITPIYGVQGQEARDIPYLSPQWMEMLTHTLAEAERYDLGVDMATGTGWPFGGPNVTEEDSEDKLVIRKTRLEAGRPVTWDGGQFPQALAAVSDAGENISLLGRLGEDGSVAWTPPDETWTLYAVTQTWAGRLVKRAAPGSEGRCINPFSRQSLTHYLERFDAALAPLPAGALRCEFHDSFEYLADWAPTVFSEFQNRHRYDLRDHVPALAGDAEAGETARVRTDYRETIAEMLRENFTQTWTDWAHTKGSLSRNQAHGSPGNLLDLYGTADIPETEIFGGLGDPRANKFASSAAHVLGKPLTSSESCTWLAEHFTVSLGQCKAALDRLLAAGINHIFYHGTPYSPADAAWPGWLFYASTTFAPDDPLWHDFPTLNAYVTRCQSVLQAGKPDNDVLLYWPLHDLWQKKPDAFMLEINGTWLTEEPVGAAAQTLWERGIGYDYVSDRQLGLAQTVAGDIQMPGGAYRTIVAPPCTFMPATTLQVLLTLAEAGATVIFQDGLPTDVPGLGTVTERRQHFRTLLNTLSWQGTDSPGLQQATVGAGRFLTGPDLASMLAAAQVRHEPVTDIAGLLCLRQKHPRGHDYFLANQGESTIDGWVAFAKPFRSAVLKDPMTGRTGVARTRTGENGLSLVFLTLVPGASVLVHTVTAEDVSGPEWLYWSPAGAPIDLTGTWAVEFLEGGPTLPAPFETQTLGSWAETGGEDTERFSGTARYRITFDAPAVDATEWRLDLGRVAESARVRLNGREIGTLIAAPFEVFLGSLEATGNVLEIEVTNLAANRIRDRDRRGLPWKIFHEINFVNIDYQPFDASEWPVHESGLLGPVRLTPMRAAERDDS